MGRVSTTSEYGTQPTILFHPEGWSAFPHTFAQGDPLATNGVIKAGTFFPSNGSSTRGIVLFDVDVSKGPAEGSILYEGDVRLDRLPESPVDLVVLTIDQGVGDEFPGGGVVQVGSVEVDLTRILHSRQLCHCYHFLPLV